MKEYMKKVEAECQVDKIYNYITWIDFREDEDPNAFELVEIFTKVNELKLEGNPVSKQTENKMRFIWGNREINIGKNNLSYDSLFYKICKSTYDGELAHIKLSEKVKYTLKKMAAIDLYINQRRRVDPMYMHDNVAEMIEVATLIEEAKKEIESEDYEMFINEFERVLTEPPSQHTKSKK